MVAQWFLVVARRLAPARTHDPEARGVGASDAAHDDWSMFDFILPMV
jgi:hypothetical protein